MINDADADSLKAQIREVIGTIDQPDELFFYFTGHGYQHGAEFFYCTTNFDVKRPNETGISTTELHSFLRLADAKLVIKVIDACNSGTMLIKSGISLITQNKDGFNNLIQIASCLDSQNSLTGNPLSLFTESFRDAALRKKEGIVYYTDIINTLRDRFIDNELQTPFFVSQHTGREQFVDDATKLAALRIEMETLRTPANEIADETQGIVERSSSLLDRLKAADSKIIQPEKLSNYVNLFFDKLIRTISESEFSEFFSIHIVENASFSEMTTEKFIARTLSNEKRADNFVTATYSRKSKQLNPMVGLALMEKYVDEDFYKEEWSLYLNCVMPKAQIKIIFTPKFITLQRVILVVSCAPSLDTCYIFELSAQHMLKDFGKYDESGTEYSRRWWKLAWGDEADGVVSQISSKLTDAIRGQLESAEKRLPQE